MPCTCCSRDPAPSGEKYEPFISIKELGEKCPLDSKTTQSFKFPMVRPESAINISLLVKMPIEIFQRTLKYLDIETLVNIRRCSQYCRLAVEATLEWQEISENAPEALRAILSTGVGSHVLLLQLHHALTNPECEFCVEDFEPPTYLDDEKVMGAFLSLFDGKRACAYCLRNDVSLRTIPYIDFIRLQRPNSAIKIWPEVQNPPKLRTLPGTYGYNRYKSSQRLLLVPLGNVEYVDGMTMSHNERQLLLRSQHEVIIPKHPFADRPVLDRQLAPHNAYVGFEREDEIARRYMTAIPFSYFGKTHTHPNTKKRVNFHGCIECHLQERYHERQLVASFNQGDADAVVTACAENLYKRQTRQWLNDVDAEKIHARDFHERIEGEEQEWRKRRQVPLLVFSEPDNSKDFRMYDYDYPLLL
ncbi:putative f-box domain-containing protein [Botrytis fragariae]|uniref:Putative f-box domain-containing protein n=1 Tax=Botrytis fragariae TaxID=1964551 RepID=A0A8H6EP56_9HELO|nr:putative f-box domain-containing protein [Botrytis fragariae]KAF5879378.1 putative f-box domain-containing protein [Botrytis fragariae]